MNEWQSLVSEKKRRMVSVQMHAYASEMLGGTYICRGKDDKDKEKAGNLTTHGRRWDWEDAY